MKKNRKLKMLIKKAVIPAIAFVFILGMSSMAYAEDTGSAIKGVTAGESSSTDAKAGTEGADSEDEPKGVNDIDMDSFDMSKAKRVSNDFEGTAFASESNDSAQQYWTYFTAGVTVLGILALAAVVAFIIVYKKRKKKEETVKKYGGKAFNISMGALTAVSLVLIIVVNVVTSMYSNTLNSVFTRYNGVDVDSTSEDWVNLAYNIANEGMVLLENNNQALPIDTAQNAKINLLGYYAYNPYYSGTGSGGTDATNAISIVQGMEDSGFEVNPAVTDEKVYELKEEESSLGFETATYAINEASQDKYTGEASFENMKSYSDTAVVVLGRVGGEGSDLTDYEGDSMYLELAQEEKDLLANATETFEKVIVVYNGANALEMNFMKDYDIDALIWAGEPGEYGFESLGKILNGEVNPSGSIVDTWVYDSYSAAASENFANQTADNIDSYYVDYVEGIYVGYKWYETAYKEGAVIENTTNGKTYDYSDYYSVVRYPFGYGLSYTTFDQEIAGGISEGDSFDPTESITVDVKVTNTGDSAGKETVQLYATVPYTDYDKANGIEKAAVSLMGYAKTGELGPGESETVTVEINAEDMASYDSGYDNGTDNNGAYMLDEGDYILSVRSDSHTELDAINVSLDETYFYSGDNKRSSDEQQAYNQFEDAARGIYLSRQNGFENYEEAMNSVSPSVKSTEFDENPGAYDPAYDEAVVEIFEKGVDYDADGDLTIADMEGLDYDDPQWDDILKQLSIEDMVNLVSGGLSGTGDIDSIEMGAYANTEGPSGISSMYNNLHTVSYPCITTLAATFNDGLAYTYGQLIADQAHELGVASWNGPAMNIHRWAYSGRNFEYYSEDGMLSAGMAGNEVKGATDNKLVTYNKHFALNDMESHRSGQLHTYSNEQAIREIYFKPFEAAVKTGNTHGIMSAMSYIGDIYVSASAPLLTEVLRNEWGFDGAVITDMAEGNYAVQSSDSCVRAGTNTWLAIMPPELSTDSDADIYYLREASKGILYAFANGEKISSDVYNWQAYVYAVSAELAVFMLICIGAIIMRNKRSKQNKANTPKD